MDSHQVVGIYHKDCSGNDGQTAAAVLLRKFPDAAVFPLNYSYAPDEIAPILKTITPETTVYTVDIAVAIKACLAAGAAQVITIDHHESRADDLADLAAANPKFTYVFDNAKCGSSLAWSYFFPSEPLPRFIQLVEGYDIHNKNLNADGENLHFVLDRYKDQPQKVLELMEKRSLDELIAEGKHVADYVTDMTAKYFTKTAPLVLEIDGIKVKAYNGLFFKNDIARIAVEKNPTEPVIVFNIDGPKVNMSVRSEDTSPVSALDVARTFGGGGHRNASGARAPLEKFLALVVKS